MLTGETQCGVATIATAYIEVDDSQRAPARDASHSSCIVDDPDDTLYPLGYEPPVTHWCRIASYVPI